MKKITTKINNLSLPVAILLASIIFGGFYLASEIYKQSSIEEQKHIERWQNCIDRDGYSYKQSTGICYKLSPFPKR